MGLISELKGTSVFIDIAPLIYFIEGNSLYQNFLSDFFKAVDNGDIEALTSTITLIEVLVYPLKLGKTSLAEEYEKFILDSRNLEVFDLTSSIAKKAAQIRARFGFKTPDSIQLATAIECKANHFLSNDHDLKRVSGMNILLLNKII